MKKFNPTKLLFGFLGLATLASLVGSISGTLAWYAYSTRASLSYSGTSIDRTAQLQIGVVSKEVMSLQYGNMTEDTTIHDAEGNHYYFMPIGSGLSADILNEYLTVNGYATNYLVPVTSGKYQRGDDFSLKKSPNPDSGVYNNSAVAPNDFYAHFQFVFRIAKNSYAATIEYAPDQEIWLTHAEARASSGSNGNIHQALRVFFDRDDNDYEDDFIFSPTSNTATGGETKVGGLLDIGGDGYYDVDENNNEIIYGEYTTNTGKINNYNGADEIDDVNGTNSSELNTFTAKHRNGVNYYNDLSGCGIKTAKYESLNSIVPVKNNGVWENVDSTHPTSLCTTKASNYNLGRFDMTVYLEGWDFSVIDEENGSLFDIGLTFEINRVSA